MELNKPFLVFGNNSNKVSNKIESFNKVLSDLSPAVFTLQETKRKMADPPMKINNLCNYQVYDIQRETEKKDGGKGIEGGGLAIGVLHKLNPVLTREGNDEVECLTVEFKVSKHKFLCVTGYGPQLGDSVKRKARFWNYLEEEAKSAHDRNIGLIIQIDSNSWLGNEVIPGDPNKQNSNGKLMVQFLNNNPALTVVNSLSLCQGTVTRQRTTTVRREASILDVFIVCRKVLGLIKHMKVDHEGKYRLTNFNVRKKTGKVTVTEHSAVLLVLDLSIPTVKCERTSEFNYKNTEGQKNFFNMTNKNSSLTEVFSTSDTFQSQGVQWEKNVKSCIRESFPKVRPRKRKFREYEVGHLLEIRKKLKLSSPSAQKDFEIEKIEEAVANKLQMKYFNSVKECIGEVTGEDGNINGNGVWKATRKIFPKHKEAATVAFKDNHGNFITGYDAIENFALHAIIERLQKRPINPQLKELERLKTKLSRLRINMSSKRKSLPWTLKEMEVAIRSMKNKKCKASQGIINELLKPDVAGKDFKLSLLSLLIMTKSQLEIPETMKHVIVALIPKPGKKNKHKIENHRGIFLIPKYRILIMRMLLNDKYPILDKFMSDSNIGGCKGRGIRDNLFVLNGIIHEHCKSKTSPISIQILDYMSCFDSLWADEVMNDLYEAGVSDDKLALIKKQITLE